MIVWDVGERILYGSGDPDDNIIVLHGRSSYLLLIVCECGCIPGVGIIANLLCNEDLVQCHTRTHERFPHRGDHIPIGTRGCLVIIHKQDPGEHLDLSKPHVVPRVVPPRIVSDGLRLGVVIVRIDGGIDPLLTARDIHPCLQREIEEQIGSGEEFEVCPDTGGEGIILRYLDIFTVITPPFPIMVLIVHSPVVDLRFTV